MTSRPSSRRTGTHSNSQAHTWARGSTLTTERCISTSRRSRTRRRKRTSSPPTTSNWHTTISRRVKPSMSQSPKTSPDSNRPRLHLLRGVPSKEAVQQLVQALQSEPRRKERELSEDEENVY